MGFCCVILQHDKALLSCQYSLEKKISSYKSQNLGLSHHRLQVFQVNIIKPSNLMYSEQTQNCDVQIY